MAELTLLFGGEDDVARKRRYGSGSVRQKGSTWYIRFRPYPGGKQVEEKVGREADGVNREAAEHALLERLVAVGRGEGKTFEGHLFENAVEGWRTWDRSLNDTSRRTQDLDDSLLECHLLPAFEGLYLHQIDFRLLERYLVAKTTYVPGDEKAAPVRGPEALKRTKPLSKRYLEQHMTLLSKIFTWAQREGWMLQNPVPLISWRQSTTKAKSKNKPEPLEREHVQALLLYSRDEERELQILVLAKLGLRLGELLGLYTSDYVAKTRTLRIRRTLTREGAGTVLSAYPKTASGSRDLVVSEELGMRLERQLARANSRPAMASGRRLLFGNTKGNIHTEANFRNRNWAHTIRDYQRAVEAGRAEDVELDPSITPHRLRHTAASEWILNGTIPDVQISYWLGHKNASITRQIYAHVFSRAKRDIADLPDLYSHEVAA